MTKNRRYWQNLLRFILLMLLASIVVVGLFVSYQGAMAFVHPRRITLPSTDTPAFFGADYEEITLNTQDGVTLSAWYTPSQNGSVILIAHGYGGARSAELHALFAAEGYGVISWDARAHGLSGGDTSTIGYLEALDAKAALDYALQQDGVAHVGAYGMSMGAATVIRAAARRGEIEAVVADSAYPALDEMISRVSPFPLLHPFIRFFAEREVGMPAQAMRPVDEIGQISPRPVFIIQGDADQVVPGDSAQRLYAAAGEPKTLWVGPGIGHVRMRAAQPEEYDRRVFAFFAASLGGR